MMTTSCPFIQRASPEISPRNSPTGVPETSRNPAHLVELLLALEALQRARVPPFTVLPAYEGSPPLWSCPRLQLLFRGEVCHPEKVGVLVADGEKELPRREAEHLAVG